MPQEITKLSELKQIFQDHKKVIIDFYATFCGPCKKIAPEFEKLSTLFPDIHFVKVNTETGKEIADAYNIQVIPMFLFFENHGVEHESFRIRGPNKGMIQMNLQSL